MNVHNPNPPPGFQQGGADSAPVEFSAPPMFRRARQHNNGFLSPVHYLIRLRQRHRSETRLGARDWFVTNS